MSEAETAALSSKSATISNLSPAKAWLMAARLRTLPLALACVGMGCFLAAAYGSFNWVIAVLCILTTLFLQILSNFANDYGDTLHGADSQERTGPKRAVQAGYITAKAMKKAIILFAVLSLISGVGLLVVSLHDDFKRLFYFLALGIMCILAAIAYTNGKRPYGYSGFGDMSVFLFFGIVAVAGTFYLFKRYIPIEVLLPAASCGLFSTAVLNVNNIRDISSDEQAGKLSIPVRLGQRGARVYHVLLLTTGVLSAAGFVLLIDPSPVRWLFLLSMPLFVFNGVNVWKKQTPAALDPYLKQMALSTLAFVLLFGVGQLL